VALSRGCSVHGHYPCRSPAPAPQAAAAAAAAATALRCGCSAVHGHYFVAELIKLKHPSPNQSISPIWLLDDS
jgi:hypothetical protein